MYDRSELVAAINEVLSKYNEHEAGAALYALDALGFIAGEIFSQAPDCQSHQVGRLQFLAAVEAGMAKGRGRVLH